MVEGGRLELVGWDDLWARVDGGGELLSPTLKGWCRFLKVWERERAVKKPRWAVAEGRQVARFWWGRRLG